MIRLDRLEVNGFKQLRDIDLTFPAHGHVFIEGQNESGKSTLFEAVYYSLYGRALTDARTISTEDLISTRLDEAVLRLTLSADGTQLVVLRELRKGRQSKATLTITHADGSVDPPIRGTEKVTAEIIAQLHGLDAESLRHSCYVEQRGLDRLSTLKPDQRANILLQLLDQGELVQASKHFNDLRPKADEITRAQQIVNLAGAWRHWRETEALRVEAERVLWRAQLAQALADWAEQLARERLELEQARQRERLAVALDERIEQLEAKQTAARDIQNLGTARSEAGQLAQAVAGWDRQLADLDDLAANQLPGLRGRARLVELAEGRRAESAHADGDRLAAEARAAKLQAAMEHETESDRQRASLAALAAELPAAREQDDQARRALTGGQTWHRDLAESERRLSSLKDLEQLRMSTRGRQEILNAATAEAAQAAEESGRLAEQLAQARQRQAAADRAAAWRDWAAARQQADGEQAAQREVIRQQDLVRTAQETRLAAAEAARGAAAARQRWSWAGGGLAVLLVLVALGTVVFSVTLAAAFARPALLVVAAVAALAGLALGGGAVVWWLRQARALAAGRADSDQARVGVQAASETRARAEAQLEVFGQKETALMTMPRERLAQLGVGEPESIAAAESLAQSAAAESGPDRPDLAELEAAAQAAQARATSLAQPLAAERSALAERDAQLVAGLQAQQVGEADLPGAIQELEAALQAKRAGGLPDLVALETAARQAHAALDAQGDQVGTARGVLQQRDRDRLLAELALASAADAASALEAAQAAIETAGAARDAAWTAEAEMLVQLALEADATQAERVLSNETQRLKHVMADAEKRVAGRPTIQLERNEQAAALQAKQDLIAELSGRLGQQAGGGLISGVPEPGGEPDAARALLAEVAAANLPDLRIQSKERRRESAEAKTRSEQAAQMAVDACGRVADSWRLLGLDTPLADSPDGVQALLPDLPDPDPAERARLAKVVQDHRDAEAGHRRMCETLQQDLALDPATIDEAAETARLEALRRQHSLCRLALDVIARTKTSVINRLLPDTREFACRILPLLTNGRYRDLDLDEKTFQLQVWDDRFKRMVRREVFSGGAQDQFALSLRLGFALAALPQGLGATPAFIFLDEPVASFDRIRREAFVELVRGGIIGQRFDQVFVAEPEGIFPENPFSHYLRLEAGRVVEQSWGGPAN